MKRILLGVLAAAVLLTSTQAAEWKLDPVHSTIGFKVSHLVISKVGGQFSEFEGSLIFDDSAIEHGSVTFSAKTASIDTDNEDRDKHLKSPEFFDVTKFPEMTFKSKKVVKKRGSEFQLVGDLTIHGVTKEVSLDCVHNGSVKDPWGNMRAGFSGETTINRQDFGLTWSKNLDSGGLVLGNEVKISIEVEFIMAK